MKNYLFAAILLMLAETAVEGDLTCGGQEYDLANDLCCNNVLHTGKLAENEQCCGDKSFDPRTQRCPGGTIIQRTIDETMTCFANGTIKLMNDNSDVYSYAMAVQGALTASAQKCTVDISNNPEIKISGCPAGKEITLFLSSSDTLESNVVGGQSSNLRSVSLQCVGFPESGVNVTVVNVITAQVTIPTVTYSAAPYVFLESKIWDPETLEFTTSAMAGDQLSWSIKLPETYTGLPVRCTAFSGTNPGGVPNKDVIINGCSLENGLIGNFTAVTEPGLNGLTAPLWAFSFYNSPSIYLHCTIRLCPPESTACSFTCEQRRRRAVKRDNEDDMMRETGVTLRIMQNQSTRPLSGASRLEGVSMFIGMSLTATLTKLLNSHNH